MQYNNLIRVLRNRLALAGNRRVKSSCILSEACQITGCYIIILFRALRLSSRGCHAVVLILSLPARSAR
jgi:hypothetical protein